MATSPRGRGRRGSSLSGGSRPAPRSPHSQRSIDRAVPEEATFAGAAAMADSAAAFTRAATHNGMDQTGRLGSLFQTLGAQMGSAIDAWSDVLAEQAAKRLEKENEALGREALRVSLSDPTGVDAAVRSGDSAQIAALSRLSGIDANRPEFVDNIRIMHGQNMAMQDFQERLRPAIEHTQFMGGNPRQTVTNFMNEQMKGADPVFETAYRQAIHEMSMQHVGRWHENQREYVLSRQREHAIDEFRSRVMSDEGVGIHDVERLVGTAVATGITAEDRLRARDEAVFEVFRVANDTGNAALLEAIAQPDPENNGLSLADQHRDLWDKALSSSLSRWREVTTMEAEQDLSRISLMVEGLKSGTAGTVVTPAGERQIDSDYAMAELLHHRSAFGFSNQWEAEMKKVMNVVGGELELKENYKVFSSAISGAVSSPYAGAPYISTEAMNKYGSQFVEQYTAQRLSEGVDQSQVAGELAKAAANYGGFGKDFNTRMEHDFTVGNPEAAMAAFSFYNAVEKSQNTPGGAAAMISDSAAKAKFDFMYSFVERFGGSPAQAFAQFQEAARLRGDTSWRGFARKILPEKEVSRWVDDVADGVVDATGADVPFSLRRLIEEELSRQLWMSTGVVADTDNKGYASFGSSTQRLYTTAVAKGILDRIEVGYDPVTQRQIATLRMTPRVAMASDNTVVAARGITANDHVIAEAAFTEQWSPIFGTLFGDRLVGISPTAEAYKGNGAQVYVENNVGDVGELMFPYGRLEMSEEIEGGVSVPLQGELPEGMSWNKDGSLTVENTGKEIRLGSFVIAPHPTEPKMASVYYVGDVPETQAELLARNRKELEERAAQLELDREKEQKRQEDLTALGWPYSPRTQDETTKGTPTEEALKALSWPSNELPPTSTKRTTTAATDTNVADVAPVVANEGRIQDGDREGVSEAVSGPSAVEPTTDTGKDIDPPGRGSSLREVASKAAAVASTDIVPPGLANAIKEKTSNLKQFGEDLWWLVSEPAPSSKSPRPDSFPVNPAIKVQKPTRKPAGVKAIEFAKDLHWLAGEYSPQKLFHGFRKTTDSWFAAPSKKHAEESGRGEEPSLVDAWKEKFSGWVSNLRNRGYVGGDTAVIAGGFSPEDAEQFLEGLSQTQALAAIRNDPMREHGTRTFVSRAADHIVKEEGYSSTSYKDGRTRSIGYGFNLQRVDFKQMLTDFGYDLGKVWRGEEDISKEHALMLRDYEIGRLEGLIRKDLKGVGVPEHVMLALIDMGYNLGEGRVRPVTRLVREGKLKEAAEYAINIKPPSWLSARVQEVVRQRRIRNAYMLLGYDVIKK